MRSRDTCEGKVIVRSHDDDRDAQKINAEFLIAMTKSTEAQLATSALMSYLTSTRINDGTWRGTSKNFVLNWVDKLRIYHDMVYSIRTSQETSFTVLTAFKALVSYTHGTTRNSPIYWYVSSTTRLAVSLGVSSRLPWSNSD
jgi:hypothetical protein